MKKITLGIICLALAIFLPAQIDQQQSTIVNVAVPVRVLDGDQFVDSITINDFEILENGIPQKIDALYLVKNSSAERREVSRDYDPILSRTFYFLFQLTDWDPKISDAVKYFFDDVFLPGDSLVVMTPERNLRLSPQVFQSRPKEQTIEELVNILRKDINLGNSRYKTTMRNLRRLIAEIKKASGVTTGISSPDEIVDEGFSDSSMSLELVLPRYTDAIQEMDDLRFVDQSTFLAFAESLKNQPNQKNVYLFYQREFRPEISPSILSDIQMNFQDKPHILGKLSEIFDLYKRDVRFDGELINQAFADASILLNFIFTDKVAERYAGINMREQSEDVYKIFTDVANSTGGVVINSQNLSTGFQLAAKISGQYYLLYYTPANLAQDGSFKNIEVNVKNGNYKVTARNGYFAR